MENLIAVYCNSMSSIEGVNSYETLPRHVRNRLDTARSLFSRLVRSHADDSLIKVIFFARSREEAEFYARLSSLPDAGADECRNIAEMVEKVLRLAGFHEKGKGEKDNDASIVKRIYFVLSNWQWQYIEPLLRLKDQRFRFFFEGALDDRSIDEIDAERRVESMLRMKAGSSMIERFMDLLASDLKG